MDQTNGETESYRGFVANWIEIGSALIGGIAVFFVLLFVFFINPVFLKIPYWSTIDGLIQLAGIAAIFVIVVVLVWFLIISLIWYSKYSQKHLDFKLHRKKILEDFKSWLGSTQFLPGVKDTANMPDDTTLVQIDRTRSVSKYMFQHFETGYPKLNRERKLLETQIDHHNKETKEFFQLLKKQLIQKVNLPDSPKAKRYTYYGLITALFLRKVVVGKPKGLPKIKENEDKCLLRWSGSDLIVGTKVDCEKGKEIIQKLFFSKEIVKRAKELHEKAGKLVQKGNVLSENVQSEVIDYLDMGGMIRGKCEICDG